MGDPGHTKITESADPFLFLCFITSSITFFITGFQNYKCCLVPNFGFSNNFELGSYVKEILSHNTPNYFVFWKKFSIVPSYSKFCNIYSLSLLFPNYICFSLFINFPSVAVYAYNPKLENISLSKS